MKDSLNLKKNTNQYYLLLHILKCGLISKKDLFLYGFSLVSCPQSLSKVFNTLLDKGFVQVNKFFGANYVSLTTLGKEALLSKCDDAIREYYLNQYKEIEKPFRTIQKIEFEKAENNVHIYSTFSSLGFASFLCDKPNMLALSPRDGILSTGVFYRQREVIAYLNETEYTGETLFGSMFSGILLKNHRLYLVYETHKNTFKKDSLKQFGFLNQRVVDKLKNICYKLGLESDIDIIFIASGSRAIFSFFNGTNILLHPEYHNLYAFECNQNGLNELHLFLNTPAYELVKKAKYNNCEYNAYNMRYYNLKLINELQKTTLASFIVSTDSSKNSIIATLIDKDFIIYNTDNKVFISSLNIEKMAVYKRKIVHRKSNVVNIAFSLTKEQKELIDKVVKMRKCYRGQVIKKVLQNHMDDVELEYKQLLEKRRKDKKVIKGAFTS